MIMFRGMAKFGDDIKYGKLDGVLNLVCMSRMKGDE